MNCDFDYTVLDKAIEKYGNKESSLIAVLQAAQEAYRYLPKEIFPYLSEKLKLSEAKIYGVATFYENFSLEPKGKYVLKVCDGTACHVRHSTDVLDYLRKELGLSAAKKTTDDRMFTVETVACLGACGLAPVITVNGHVYSQMTKEKAAKVLEELREGKIDA
ncbi:MAG: NAD(P)H-dependent oxidoreductase subunit E [Faecalibacterium sp.]|nr:NAD(P)H-dependent oxidoreductase subunit E [Faecalibacterium sp.]